jgi:signal transduction histidine kinase
MEDLRRSLANLRATGLGDRPLTEALQTLCGDARQRSGTGVECELAEGTNRLPPRVSEVIWRVAQEALTNAEKHAHARHVQVRLKLPPKEVLLEVRDDGVGLSPDAESKPGHYGLRGLRERVEGLGGTFTMTASENKGTLIAARIPLIA